MASSSSSTSQWTYDVFLSFRGEDTRNTAVDFLNYALQRRGVYIFKDDKKLKGGKTIKPELLKAIEESRFALVILSENYASSTWCLEELVKIIDCEKKKGMIVLPIFYNVDPSDLRKLKGAFAKAFDKHEKQFKEKVGKWRDALNHVAGIVGYHVKNSPLSEAVKWIVGRLSHKSSFEFSKITEGLVGIHSRLVELESCLALWLKDDVRFIGIWAMGGMGKSTLASVVYRMVFKEFEASCFIDNVREKDELSLQKELISQILDETNLIKNKYDGADMIKKILWNKKVLLVLDDVDESKKLKMLVRKSDRFGSGSRIIITTRDKHLLKEFPVDEIFEVKALNYEDALCLFCSKAFKKEQCPDEYLELFKSFLEYANGLPLALEVLGSFLFEKSIAEWKSLLEMLKEDPEPEINKVLKISFDGLPDSVKDIFKDIACLFNHEEKDHVVRMLDSIGRHSDIGLRILIDKSLLKIFKNNELWMHDLLREMGRGIVRQESRDEPGKRSRLWLYKDIDHVLKNNKGTKKVQAMDIRGVEAFRPGFTVSLWNPNAFSKMSNLKFLRVSNVFLQHVPEYLPNSLRYLKWSGYPAKSLPCFQPNELVQLHLQDSKIEFLWEGMKIFENLKSINMEGSSDLIISPNFNGVQNLEELVLARCSNLRKLHPSIGKLKKLKLLDLASCQELTNLPDKFEMESLVTLYLNHCLKVKKIPKTICSLTSLNNLCLSGCSKLDKLPEDLGNIVSLKKLNLSGTAIKELPLSVEFLIGLTSLNLRDCKKFDKLPKDLGNIASLEVLDLSGTAITELPSSIEFLIGLRTLYLEGCTKFVNLPNNLGNLKHLNYLCLEGTAIEVLPSSVEHLAALMFLTLKDCKNLVCLPSTICNLKRVTRLDLTRCSKIANLPENLGNMESLEALFLGETAIKELPSSTIHLEQVWRVSLKGCQLSSSSLTSMPRCREIDLSDCNLSAIPSGIDCIPMTGLFLRGNDFDSLPESISQFSTVTHLYLDGCKSLRSLSNIPAKVEFICVDNCTSLERLPVPPNDFFSFSVQCFNCFKLADNIQNFSNMFQGQSGQQVVKGYIIPGREIPEWCEKANVCDTFAAGYRYSSSAGSGMTYKRIKKVKIQLPGSGSGCDEWRGIVLCVVFKPIEPHVYRRDARCYVDGCLMSFSTFGLHPTLSLQFTAEHGGQSEYGGEWSCTYYTSEYDEVESHHLWLYSFSKEYLPHTEIDNNGFHQVELEIEIQCVEVEKIGFRVV